MTPKFRPLVWHFRKDGPSNLHFDPNEQSLLYACALSIIIQRGNKEMEWGSIHRASHHPEAFDGRPTHLDL